MKGGNHVGAAADGGGVKVSLTGIAAVAGGAVGLSDLGIIHTGGGSGQNVQQSGVGLGQGDGHFIITGGLHALHAGQQEGGVSGSALQPVQGEGHVGSLQLLAGGEPDALVQGEGIGQAVVGDDPLGSHAGQDLGFIGVVAGDQGGIHGVQHHLGIPLVLMGGIHGGCAHAHAHHHLLGLGGFSGSTGGGGSDGGIGLFNGAAAGGQAEHQQRGQRNGKHSLHNN